MSSTKEKQEETQVAIYQDKYAKSNFLIGSKYKSSLLENKLMMLSLSRPQDFVQDPEHGLIYQEIKVAEIRKVLGVKGGGFYENLANAAEAMTSKSIGAYDPDKKYFDYIAVVIRASCKNGVFRIEYNPHLTKYIKGLRQNYTTLSQKIMLSFDSVYSFRLYEVLRSKCYYAKGTKKTDNAVFNVPYSVAELKLQLGVVNSNLDSVRRILRQKENPDYEKAVEQSSEKVLEDWHDFHRRALDPAIKEINKKSDMEVSYETERAGRGGKVHSVTFYVKYKEVFKAGNKRTETVDKEAVMEAASEIFGDLSFKDVKAICEAAKYDIEKIEKAYLVMESSHRDIDSVTGFIISAIKKEYKPPTSKRGKKNQFSDFEQREIDFDELERKLTAQ